MADIKDRYKRFKAWEKQPHEVAPLSEDEHVCATCGTRFEGNYCPRCGQSAKIGRYSFKKAFLLFLDVWGVGNRGMFRTVRDLLLRPGFMIRDYLRGMQMAYFPPFKMFFLLITLTILIDSGLNIKGINRYDTPEEKDELVAKGLLGQFMNVDNLDSGYELTVKEGENKKARGAVKVQFNRIMREVDAWIESHSSVVELFYMLLFSVPLWLLFRHCPAIPDFRLSECFVAMVYITNMCSIYGLIPSLLCFSPTAEGNYGALISLLIIIPIKQLSGYSYGKTIWRLVLSLIPTMGVILVLELLKIFAVFGYAFLNYG